MSAIPVIVGALGTIPKKFEKRLGKLEILRKNKNYSGDSTVKIYRNTKTSLGKLKRLAVVRISGNTTNKRYMHNPESVLENETQKNYLGFWDKNGSSNLTQTTRPSVSQKKEKEKENLLISGLSLSGWPQGKTERKRKEG